MRKRSVPEPPRGVPPPVPLSAHEMRSMILRKGWSFAELADRWGVTRARISQMISEGAQRPSYLEDAVWGLPYRSVARFRDERRRSLAVDTARKFKPPPPSRPRKKRAPAGAVVDMAAWWEQTLKPGYVLTVKEDISESLLRGVRGVVLFRIGTSPDSMQLCVGYETGVVEWYPLAWFHSDQCWLHESGQTAEIPQKVLTFQHPPAPQPQIDRQLEAMLRAGHVRFPVST